MKDLLLLVKNNFKGLTGKELIRFLRSNIKKFNYFFGSRSSKTELNIKFPLELKDRIVELFSEYEIINEDSYINIKVDTNYSVNNISVIQLFDYLKQLSELSNRRIEAYNCYDNGGVNLFTFIFNKGSYEKNIHRLTGLAEEETLDSLGEIAYRSGYSNLADYSKYFIIE